MDAKLLVLAEELENEFDLVEISEKAKTRRDQTDRAEGQITKAKFVNKKVAKQASRTRKSFTRFYAEE